MNTRFVTWMILCCALALVLSGCGGTGQPAQGVARAAADQPTLSPVERVVAEGKLVPEQHIELAFASGGRVKEVLVEEGQRVDAGQVLARLEGGEAFVAQEAAAKLEIIQVEQALRDLADDTFLDLAQVSAELEAAQQEYDTAEQAWDGENADTATAFETALRDYVDAEEAVQKAQKKLNDESDQAWDAPVRVQVEKDLGREQERRAKAYQALQLTYENPQEGDESDERTRLVKAVARLEAARLQLKQRDGGADPDLEATLQARLEAARAAQVAAQEGQRALEVRAPWNGTLVDWELKVGQGVAAGQPVGGLVDTAGWLVETTDLTENGVVAVKSGDRVSITVDSLPGESFTGTVESIRGRGEKYQGDMTYRVRIRMDQNDPRWYWNMNVKVTIEG